MFGELTSRGDLTVRKLRKRAPLLWRVRNGVRPAFWLGWLANRLAFFFSWVTGIPTMTGELSIVLRRADGWVIDYGTVSYRVITTAFVNFVTDQLQTETSVFGDFKYHDSGTGTGAEAVGDTGLGTKVETGRATGTQTESAANAYRSVGTISYTATRAITEHGLFNDPTTGTLMDRSVFTAVNVVNLDSIEYTYTHTFNAGG